MSSRSTSSSYGTLAPANGTFMWPDDCLHRMDGVRLRRRGSPEHTKISKLALNTEPGPDRKPGTKMTFFAYTSCTAKIVHAEVSFMLPSGPSPAPAARLRHRNRLQARTATDRFAALDMAMDRVTPAAPATSAPATIRSDVIDSPAGHSHCSTGAGVEAK